MYMNIYARGIVIGVFLLFMSCSRQEGQHAYQHDSTDAAHTQEETTHTHEGEGVTYSHEETTHTHDDGEAAHIQDAADQTQAYEEEASTNEHTTVDHVADEGLIAVDSSWEKLIGLETAVAQFQTIDLLIAVPGKIIPNQNQLAIVSPFIEASINCVFVNIGDKVKEGDLLACVTSPQIGILRAEYDKAKAELEIANTNYARQQKLFQENIISEKSFQEAELSQKVAEVNNAYAMKKLLAMGVMEDELDNPPEGHSDAVGSTLHIHAPISGVITARNASIGQKVDLSTRLFEVVNLDNVWLEADIFEKDLASISLGQTVHVSVTAFPENIFSGNIFYIGNTLNNITKTIKILVEINNSSHRLKPGMFANTNIVIGKKEHALVVPIDAILDDEQLKVVFVKEEADYHRHVVQIGIISNMYAEIMSGLNAGDTVVTKGNFQLKSKLKMTGVDPHAGHVH